MAKSNTVKLTLDVDLCYEVARWIQIDDYTEAVTRALRDYMRLRNAGENFDRVYNFCRTAPLINEFVKPCPFCGYLPELDEIGCDDGLHNGKRIYRLRCTNRKCHGNNPSVSCQSRADAIRTWNSRFEGEK